MGNLVNQHVRFIESNQENLVQAEGEKFSTSTNRKEIHVYKDKL
jgi:hypothetical protein